MYITYVIIVNPINLQKYQTCPLPATYPQPNSYLPFSYLLPTQPSWHLLLQGSSFAFPSPSRH